MHIVHVYCYLYCSVVFCGQEDLDLDITHVTWALHPLKGVSKEIQGVRMVSTG